jgi:LacI family transcriptional regulator
LIVPDIKNPFFGELAWRIEKKLREHGYSTILCNTSEIPENEEFYLKVLMDRQVDGIIISPIHTDEWGYLESIQKETSIVLIDRIFYETDLPWVTSDNVTAAKSIAGELIDQGHKRIAYLGGTPETYINTVRFQGYQDALRKHSLPLDENIVLCQGYSSEAGEEMMTLLLEREPDIQAVFCVNNLVFIGAMKIVQLHEMKAKPNILMAAFDISRYCNIFKRPIVCANQDLHRLADEAVSLLMGTVNNVPQIKNQVVLPLEVEKYRTY